MIHVFVMPYDDGDMDDDDDMDGHGMYMVMDISGK